MAKTPDALVAEKIVENLRKEKLLETKQLDTLADKLASGSLKSEDWQGIIEVAVDAGKASKNDKKN